MRLCFDVGTVSQTVRSGNGPYKEKYHARPALLTVSSITQSDHLITLLSIHDIADLEMFPDVIFCLIKSRLQSNMKTL